MLTLLNTTAVPFQFPAEHSSPGPESLAERRRQRGVAPISIPQTMDLQNTESPSGSRQMQLDAENQRALMAAVLNEAVKTIDYAVGPSDLTVTSRQTQPIDIPTQSSEHFSDLSELRNYNNPREFDAPSAPPNSPVHQRTVSCFEFFDFDDTDFVNDVKSMITDQPHEETPITRLRRTRSMRKRRRKSSFKDPSIKPRVVAKVPQIDPTSTSSNEEADDECSDEEMTRETKKKPIARSSSKQSRNILSYNRRLNDKGLEFGLKLIAETQKLASSSDENTDQADGMEPPKMTDWAKVGEELRSIADSFQESNGGTNLRVEATLTGVIPLDILSLLNMMLPVSIPQSLWSALVSYAAWKIFKRFQ